MESYRSVHVICNPAAGRGEAARVLPHAEKILREAGFSVTSTKTEARGHATKLASESSVDVILSLGGDGTLNEIVNGVGSKDVCIGVLPAGSGNDFCKALGVRDIADTVKALQERHCRDIDLAHVDLVDEDDRVFGRCFVNTMGIGFDAAVAIEVANSRIGTGIVPYLLAVFRTLRRYSSVPATVLFNNTELSTRMFLSCVGNGSTSGGGFRLTPSAVPDDGMLDICHVSHIGRVRVLNVLPRAVSGRHLDEPEVTMGRATHFTIELSYPLPVHLDGEILSTRARRLVVTVRPRALRFIAPTG